MRFGKEKGAGRWRASPIGIKDYPKVIRAGMSEPEKMTHARKLNMARRHLTREQRNDLIRQQLRETPERSDRRIAADLGTDKNTVSARRKELEAGGEIHHLDTVTGADGKTYPKKESECKPVTVFNPTPREQRALRDERVVERMKRYTAI